MTRDLVGLARLRLVALGPRRSMVRGFRVGYCEEEEGESLPGGTRPRVDARGSVNFGRGLL